MTKKTNDFYLDCEENMEELRAALSGVAACDKTLSVELVVVDEEEIRRLNREFRNVDRVTDVLSFPSMELTPGEEILSEGNADNLDEEDRLFLGSVAVCSKRAREQAEEYGHSYERELNYLFVHGILHCLGYDHETEEERAAMREKEEEIMQRMGLTR